MLGRWRASVGRQADEAQHDVAMQLTRLTDLSLINAYVAAGLWDHRSLGDGIEATAARRPDALALADSDRSLSARELAQRVGATSRFLVGSGVRRGEAALLVAGNTVEAVVAYHALLRIGAVAVLLDRRCGEADVNHALASVGRRVRAIAPASEGERLLPGHAVGVLTLEELWEQSGQVSSSDRMSEPPRDAPAVIVFTSGSTGRPKAVLHSLNTLTAGAANLERITGADQDMVAFLVSPVTSITGIMQMHLVADLGAAMVLDDRFEPMATLDRINHVGATFIGGAPVIAERLLRAAIDRHSPVSVSTLALGGAMLPRPLLDLASERFGITIARVYGSSEAPNFSGSLPGDGPERRLSDDGAITPGAEIRIGSRADTREGMIRGPSVFLGYLDPEDNAEVFEDGWFRTGDLIEIDDDRITVVGRLKEVVNRNGLKISLAELDAALSDLGGAIEYSTFSVPDRATGEHLAVAIVPEGSAPISLADVISHLVNRGVARRKLPEQVSTWDTPLPRTTSGKVIRSRLVMDAPSKQTELAPRLVAG